MKETSAWYEALEGWLVVIGALLVIVLTSMALFRQQPMTVDPAEITTRPPTPPVSELSQPENTREFTPLPLHIEPESSQAEITEPAEPSTRMPSPVTSRPGFDSSLRRLLDEHGARYNKTKPNPKEQRR